MNEVYVKGNNDTIVIDDKDTINKTVNKTVNVIKSDNAQIEHEIVVIKETINRIEKKLDSFLISLGLLPFTNTLKEGDYE